MAVEGSKEIEKGRTAFMDKAIYFGLGVATGVVLLPLIKRGVEKYAPTINALFESALGKAESGIENVSDLMAKARKDYLKKADDDLHPTDKSEQYVSKNPSSCQNDTCASS